MGRTIEARLKLVSCDLAIKYMVMPLKRKESAVVNFIVIHTGKTLFKIPMSKIQPNITIAPAMATKIANPLETL
jgi:hypothetical protein